MLLASSSDFGESFILEVVAILIVALIIYRKVAPWFRTKMADQREAIRAQLAAGDDARAAAEQLVARRRQERDQARDEAKAILEQATRSASQIQETGRRRADEEYERLLQHAHTQIDLEHNRIREEVTLELSAMVLDGAHRVVDAELDEPRQKILIDESIDAVEAEVSL